MRVCHFCASPGMGRGDAYTDLVNHMARLDVGIEPALLVPDNAKGLDRVDPRVHVMTYRGGRSRLNPLLWYGVAKQLRAFKPDLVHTHFAKATAIYRRVSPFVGVPWVATKHNPRKGSAFNSAPRVIAVGQAVKESVTHDRVRVIHNGLLPETIEQSPRESKPSDEPVRVLSIGRLEPIKGQDHLINALSRWDRPWRLTLFGEGPYRETLQQHAERLDVSNKVEMPGHVNDIPQQLANCDVFVQASASEGFGIALLEAMQYAPLALSTPVGLAQEVFPDWLMWDATQPDTLIERLNRLDELTTRFEQWAGPVCEQFHMDRTVQEHARYYREVLDATAS